MKNKKKGKEKTKNDEVDKEWNRGEYVEDGEGENKEKDGKRSKIKEKGKEKTRENKERMK